MTTAKTERNNLIVELIDKKKMTYEQVRKEFNFKSRGTVWEIYKREKYGVRRRNYQQRKLST